MKVLVPTDFSDSSKAAFEYGYQLVKGYPEVEMVLLNSYEMPKVGASSGVMINLESAMAKESERDLSIELKHLKENYPDVTISSVSRYGSLENSVSRTNRELEIDFVVMGTHGASGIEKAIMGSNTQLVIENVERPVVSVPKEWNFRPIKNIVYATDLKKLEHAEILKPICNLAKMSNAVIHVVYVTKDAENVNLQERIAQLPLNDYLCCNELKFKVIKSSNVVKGINEYVTEIDADIVVMIPKRISFWDKLFKPSIVNRWSFQSNVPLLSLRDK